jgi:uncharacterized protein YjbJ (UPF0337 family)
MRHDHHERWQSMRITRKIAHSAEVLKGTAKVNVGRVPGSRRLRASGRRDRAKGRTRKFGAKVMDAFKR